MKIQEQAPAKINLALNILGRRTDGYHELRMVMQSVSLCDTVTVEETGTGFTLLADGFTVPAGKSSLEQQAAEAFFAAVGRPVPPLTVHLEKTTPAYAGLGGGSADVAALLRCLRRQYAPKMPVEQLRAIGLTVGSDMPFCVSGGTALAEGRGERLTALPALPDCWIVLCKPEFGIPTPALFTLADAGTPKNRPDIDGMIRALSAEDLNGVAARLCNINIIGKSSYLLFPAICRMDAPKRFYNRHYFMVRTFNTPSIARIFSISSSSATFPRSIIT